MKLVNLLLILGIVGLSSSVARADGLTDPIFKIGTGGHSEVLTSDSFSFSLAAGTSGSVTFDFINFTGALISELDLAAPGGFTFACDNSGDPYFNTCTPTKTTPGPTTISFFGLDSTHLGIPTATSISGDCEDENEAIAGEDTDDACTPNVPLSDFTVTVVVGSTPLSAPLTVQGTLVPAPEPSTLVLVIAALGVLAAKRRAVAL